MKFSDIETLINRDVRVATDKIEKEHLTNYSVTILRALKEKPGTNVYAVTANNVARGRADKPKCEFLVVLQWTESRKLDITVKIVGENIEHKTFGHAPKDTEDALLEIMTCVDIYLSKVPKEPPTVWERLRAS